jgi:fused signal recognition particle receptor
MRLVEDLKSRVKEGMELDEATLKQQMLRSIVEIFNTASSQSVPFVPERRADNNPKIVVLIGVNGAGKTTTVAKLAHRWVAEGKKVLLAAGDTFRAAADAQLQVWADRIGVPIVTGKPNARPASVVFDAIVDARSRQSDVLLVDTAGRLNNKSSLLQELQGIISVIKKQQPDSPEEIWLVIDGTSGQNALVQAREFQKAVPITGVIITKLDGTAKGGIVVSIAHELKLPVKFVGVGETWADLRPFEPESFSQALIQDE